MLSKHDVSEAPIQSRRLVKGIATVALACGMLLLSGTAAAQEGEQPPAQADDNESCLVCHASPELQTELASGETLDLTVFPETFADSVHGRQGLSCVQCHTHIDGFPHPPIEAGTRRAYTISNYQNCSTCHEDKFEARLDSVHQRALAGGNLNAAVCSDCHGAHNIQPPAEPRTLIPQTCRQCHTQVYDRYRTSVHGEALIGQGNPDVPTCIDCHGVHSVRGPSLDQQFHLFSPQICAQCHGDQELMSQYGINTDVFDTYVADFHGTTVTLFQRVTPDQETNKPVCVDCHGVHDIAAVDSPESLAIKENLLATCQKCHPDASSDFPDAWLAHYRPSPDQWPLVYYVNLFYRFFIPAVLGGMALFVVGDAGRRLLGRGRRRDG